MQQSHREWSQWRRRLSRLDTARQAHLFAEADDLGVLGLGSVRAIDTGMSGPDIGELQHGRSAAPGSPATYGVDLDALLTAPAPVLVVRAVREDEIPTEEPPGPAPTVVALPRPGVGSPSEAA
jgi:hypothetical protein